MSVGLFTQNIEATKFLPIGICGYHTIDKIPDKKDVKYSWQKNI